jgi:hypothetical protein
MIKVVLINLIVIVFLSEFFETMARHYDHLEIKALPPVPDNARGIGRFPGFLWYIGKFIKVEEYINGGYSNIYEPYPATALRPNYEFRINNSY